MARTLLFLVLLPALVLGPASAGVSAWVHTHGPSGAHVHLVPPQAEHAASGGLHEWHAAQHRHEHEHEPSDGEEEQHPAPGGLLVELPAVLAAAPKGLHSPGATSTWMSAVHPVVHWHVAVLAIELRADRCRSGWPPQRARRSGVAELLRCSHAILI